VLDLTEYRNSEREGERVASLLALLPKRIESALDVGARDGFISKLLAERIARVTALDLVQPLIDDARIRCVKGDVTALEFPQKSVEFVLCAEVLEHIPTPLLATACNELTRVSSRYVLVGVPFKQDIRVGRTTCRACGAQNPPWGHVQSFDEARLRNLFPACDVVRVCFVGVGAAQTNVISSLLMDLAGNPFGTYAQDEPCLFCGAALEPPPERRVWQKVLTKLAFYVGNLHAPLMRRRPNWIHILFERRPRQTASSFARRMPDRVRPRPTENCLDYGNPGGGT
jgi:SAM-dependent methyltransferase